jgi:4-hydroxy-tetrahydrodipicolinate synthase
MKFRHDPASIRGAISAMVTPFTADGKLDESSLDRLARWQVASGAHGLSIGGSTGEPSSQSVDERIRAMAVVAAVAGDQLPFVPGVGSPKLSETLELTEAAQRLGADLVLVITPYYVRPTQEGLVAWFGAVAAEFPSLPIAIYNVPSRTAVDIAPETVLRLRREHSNIVGIKETTKDFEHFSRVLHLCGRDFLVWSGIELLCLPLLALGGAGFVSALCNIAPAGVARMYDAWAAGDTEGARELHYALHPLADLLFIESNPSPAKWVMQRAGVLDAACVRPPLIPLTEGGQKRALATLESAAELLNREVPVP